VTALERVLDALESRGLARGRAWRCPAHDDRGPSLSVREGEDTVLLYCHAGCTLREILAALDLTLDDLYEEGAWRGGSASETAHDAPWARYVPPPPPSGYIVIDGERTWTDWRDVEYEQETRYVASPSVTMVEKLYPELRWLTQHPLDVRAWLCSGAHLAWLQRRFPEVPSWAWTTLQTSS